MRKAASRLPSTVNEHLPSSYCHNCCHYFHNDHYFHSPSVIFQIILTHLPVNPIPNKWWEYKLYYNNNNKPDGRSQLTSATSLLTPIGNQTSMEPFWVYSNFAVDTNTNRLCSVKSLVVLILSVLLAASYIYTKVLYRKHSFSPSFKSILPSPSLAFQTTPSTFLQIPSFIHFARFNYLQTFPEHSFPNFPDTFPRFAIINCDARSFHPLANTSSKPSVPLVWFVDLPKTSPMHLTVRSYTPLLQVPYFPTISQRKLSLCSLPV